MTHTRTHLVVDCGTTSHDVVCLGRKDVDDEDKVERLIVEAVRLTMMGLWHNQLRRLFDDSSKIVDICR
jgi:hypothetical protein